VIVPEAVYEWLDRSGVLLSQPLSMEQLCGIRPEEEALLDNMLATKNRQRHLTEPQEFFRCGVVYRVVRKHFVMNMLEYKPPNKMDMSCRKTKCWVLRL
jgi:hypothetical protein